jgi:hypothetical protein
MKLNLAVPLLASVLAAPAFASLVTSVPVGVNTDVITFSPYDSVTSTMTAGIDPFDVGLAQGLESVTLSFNNPDSQVILGAVPTSLGDNGTWPYNGAYAGLNAANGFMRFDFTRGLSFVGGFVNFTPGLEQDATITALDQNGSPIDGAEWDLSASASDPSGMGLGGFYGISLDNPDIWGITFSNSFITVDNLTFSTDQSTAIPEPGSLALAALALGGLVFSTRRRRR